MDQTSSNAALAKKAYSSTFFKRGIFLATLSGIMYGFYVAFITLGMDRGVWAEWYGPQTVLTLFFVTYTIGALGSAINYTMSAIWSAGFAAFKGKIRDFASSINSRPGRNLVIASLVGGPISTSAFVIGLQMAGSIIVPITALCPAIGAILARLVYKQKLSMRMVVGIAVCFFAALLIGLTAIEPEAPPMMLAGILIASIAAFGWGFEGCVGGVSTAMIDYEISILIRQTVSGLSGLIILTPLFGLLGGDIGLTFVLMGQAVTSLDAMQFFLLSSFFCVFAFSLWYKGNAMCGTALGMACNGAFAFWGPFFTWILMGVIVGQEGWALHPVAWFSAILMVVGIWLIAVNPLDFFKKKGADV